ncbi:MAG: transposase [Chloroflexota bacterium]|nr:transposase [Chloroflexota bacterium]
MPLKQRLRPMRGFKSLTCAGIVTRGHALIQNLREGFSALTQDIPQHLRLATARPLLAATV